MSLASQSKYHSILEAASNIAVGIVISFIANIIILPYFYGKHIPLIKYGEMTLYFSIISIIRSYGLRRFWNWMHVKQIQRKYKIDKDSLWIK
jgi:hypothetical protein